LSKLFTGNGNVTTRVPRSVRVGPDVFAPSAPVSDRDGETFHQLLHVSQVDRHELLHPPRHEPGHCFRHVPLRLCFVISGHAHHEPVQHEDVTVLSETVLVTERENLRPTCQLAAGDVHTEEQQLSKLVDLAEIPRHSTCVPRAVFLSHLPAGTTRASTLRSCPPSSTSVDSAGW
jgi:hypothetical protein